MLLDHVMTKNGDQRYGQLKEILAQVNAEKIGVVGAQGHRS